MEQQLAKNAKTLNIALLDIFNSLNESKMPVDQAKELANVAGKVIKLNCGRIEYKKITKTPGKIDFWQE